MTEFRKGIPSDIWEAAKAALDQEDWECDGDSFYHEPGDLQVSEMRIRPIALAILEERKRHQNHAVDTNLAHDDFEKKVIDRNK